MESMASKCGPFPLSHPFTIDHFLYSTVAGLPCRVFLRGYSTGTSSLGCEASGGDDQQKKKTEGSKAGKLKLNDKDRMTVTNRIDVTKLMKAKDGKNGHYQPKQIPTIVSRSSEEFLW